MNDSLLFNHRHTISRRKSGGDLRSWVAKQVQPALASALSTANGSMLVRWQKILVHLNTEAAQMDESGK
ncbi:MAG: hypothetical protein M1282_18145 [Chloroflexi bacterium]|nr:hypothetical protein [Chloroflexota bacterium]